MSFALYIFCTAQIQYIYRSSLNIWLSLDSEECSVCWLVLPVTERNNFIQLSTNISLYCIYSFQRTKLYSFHNFSLKFILKIFLKFRKFHPRYSYKIYSYKKERVYLKENTTGDFFVIFYHSTY